MIRLMESAPGLTGPVNVGNPNEFTIRELAEKVVALTGSASQIAFQNLPQDDPKQRRPDITLAAEKLGWAPQVMLDAGLPKTVDYFRKLLPELHAA
jgi:UDP-glucuronate decarboxylase